ncbi:MAG: hypothetical protein ACLTYN_09505 [Dysosmobacter welbionis]
MRVIHSADLCLIDGNRDHGSSVSITAPHMCLVGGDGKSASIAAASILAKVSRDRYVTGVLDRVSPVPVCQTQGLWDEAPL